MIGTKICKNKSDKNNFNHDLKIQEDEEFIKEIKANGLKKANTLIIIYLKE